MATKKERGEMIGSIRKLPDALEAALSGLADEQLDNPGGEGEWTLRQVVHHLSDAHLNAFLRTKLILTEDRPILKPFDQERWAELVDTVREPIEPSLSILRGLHRRWADLLESVPDSGWERAGVHLESGLLTLEDILATYSNHGEVHLEQITRLKASRASEKLSDNSPPRHQDTKKSR